MNDQLLVFWPVLALVMLGVLALMGGYVVWLFWRDRRQAAHFDQQPLKHKYHV